MDSIAKYINEERDVLYLRGKDKAYLEKDEIFVKNLLEESDFSVDKIARLACVSVEFVKILNKKSFLNNNSIPIQFKSQVSQTGKLGFCFYQKSCLMSSRFTQKSPTFVLSIHSNIYSHDSESSYFYFLIFWTNNHCHTSNFLLGSQKI
jgi:hypothetical protein